MKTQLLLCCSPSLGDHQARFVEICDHTALINHNIIIIIFFQAGTVTIPTIWLVLSVVWIFLSLTTVTVTLEFFFFFNLRAWKKINKLFTSYLLENAALVLQPRTAFSRPQSQFFTIRTSQPANNIYSLYYRLFSGNLTIFYELDEI